MKFWCHVCGVLNPTVDLFTEDHVHLNEVGMERYFRSVTAAVGFALSRLH
jgi:hypothetical protein